MVNDTNINELIIQFVIVAIVSGLFVGTVSVLLNYFDPRVGFLIYTIPFTFYPVLIYLFVVGTSNANLYNILFHFALSSYVRAIGLLIWGLVFLTKLNKYRLCFWYGLIVLLIYTVIGVVIFDLLYTDRSYVISEEK